MKVALFDRPHSLRVIEKPLRALREGEILVKVEACGICGTDVHIVEGTSRSTPPVVLGHEYAGIVEDGGKTFSPLPSAKEGVRVAVDPNIACGVCFYCRRGLVHLCSNLRALGVDIDGGMAEYCIVPAHQAYVLPANVAPEVSAFVEPLSCAIHGIDRANIRAGDLVVILGGGTIGLLMLQLARNAGAAAVIVVEPLAEKRTIASRLGAALTIDPNTEDVHDTVLGRAPEGADVVIECVGKTTTMQLAVQLARRGGTVEFFGVSPLGVSIPIEPNLVYFKELSIVGSYINPHTFDRSIALLQGGVVNIEQFIIHNFPLAGVQDALEHQRGGKTLKSIVRPHM
ncbi:MAG: putative L-iditol 2-dehydrogenase protein [Bacteroidetes bacterium]|nr:putative L-iditol 2-dehydrogenase protein [Bacteroidota bacterium]